MIRRWTLFAAGAALGLLGLWLLFQSAERRLSPVLLVVASFGLMSRSVAEPEKASPPPKPEEKPYHGDAEEWRALFRSIRHWRPDLREWARAAIGIIVFELPQSQQFWGAVRLRLPQPFASVLPAGDEPYGVACVLLSAYWIAILVATMAKLATREGEDFTSGRASASS